MGELFGLDWALPHLWLIFRLSWSSFPFFPFGGGATLFLSTLAIDPPVRSEHHAS